tara:strand:+ start:1390 stop:1974 length:585 start_codon:yes stop_codon:yes gene_type:complete
MSEQGFEAYKTYLALKRHFTSDYDYAKYNGKVNVKYESFLKRKDKFFFSKIEKKHNSELVDFFVSNFIIDPNVWVGSISEEVFLQWKKNKQSMLYNFTQSIEVLYDKYNNLDDLFIIKDNQHPPLLKMYLAKEISADDMLILNIVLGFLPYWQRNLDDPVSEKELETLHKYKTFFSINREKYLNIVRERWLTNS